MNYAILGSPNFIPLAHRVRIAALKQLLLTVTWDSCFKADQRPVSILCDTADAAPLSAKHLSCTQKLHITSPWRTQNPLQSSSLLLLLAGKDNNI